MLETILRDQCGLDPAKPILVGVSGGPDSLCLLGVLQEAGYRVSVAHFNHQLRPEADREAAGVAELARRLGLPFVSAGADVRSYARKEALSLEEAARILRYRFLFAAARQQAAQAVAVGHTADDQVETVLMHFLRGAGLAGLKGMEYRTILALFDTQIPLVRPLLSLWRAETESYCQEHHLEAHFDASNADQTYFRNRLRHALIPELEKYNPRFKESLLRTAQSLQGDYAGLQELLDSTWKEVNFERGETWVAFDQTSLAAVDRNLRRHLIRRAAELLQPQNRDIGFEALQRAAVFAEAATGKQIDFINGLDLFNENGKIYLAADEADLPIAQWPQVSQPVLIGQPELTLGNGWVFHKEEMPLSAEGWTKDNDAWSAWLDADRLPPGELVIRPRQSGDSFSPLGMSGQTLKLRELYINLKIPRRARLHWPLVCAGNQVVWVAGYRIAHPFRINEKSTHIMHLVIKKLPQA